MEKGSRLKDGYSVPKDYSLVGTLARMLWALLCHRGLLPDEAVFLAPCFFLRISFLIPFFILTLFSWLRDLLPDREGCGNWGGHGSSAPWSWSLRVYVKLHRSPSLPRQRLRNEGHAKHELQANPAFFFFCESGHFHSWPGLSRKATGAC